jgi:hypothetical protein
VAVTTTPSTTPRDAGLALRESLQSIDRLSAENRVERSWERERALLQLRVRAYELHRQSGPGVWPAPVRDLFPESSGLLEISAAELTPEVLNSGITHHGGIVVRQLFTEPLLEPLIAGIDRAFASADGWFSSGGDPSSTTEWYEPLSADGTKAGPGPRVFAYRGGALWAADSPRLFFDLTEALYELGVVELVGQHFGERPAISPFKTALRRVPPDAPTGWHQDGSFLGSDIRTVNLWAAFSGCGIDSPGLEIVPRRFDGLLDSFDMDDELVAGLLQETPPLLPVFEAGDAMFFDQLFLHRTGLRPAMTRPRYGIESWFFAPSSYPENSIPLLL